MRVENKLMYLNTTPGTETIGRVVPVVTTATRRAHSACSHAHNHVNTCSTCRGNQPQCEPSQPRVDITHGATITQAVPLAMTAVATLEHARHDAGLKLFVALRI